MAKAEKVPRPKKAAEFEIRFGSVGSKKGWTDLQATTRNALVDAWDYLTRTPTLQTPTNHPLRGELGTVTHNGATHVRWQYSMPGGARIWFYVTGKEVWLEDVHTNHPNQTK
jgi:hypothetical protein